MAIKKKLAGVMPDAIGKNNAKVWDLARITYVTNELEISQQRKQTTTISESLPDEQIPNYDPDLPLSDDLQDLRKLTPSQLKIYYQTLDVQQSYLSKKIANTKVAGDLLQRADVEQAFVTSFKMISNYLDSLPDLLERDGVIESNKVELAIKSVDRIRTELANSMSTYTDELKDEL
jgi:hypothetical protein